MKHTILFVIEGEDGPMTCTVEAETAEADPWALLAEQQPSVDREDVTEYFVFPGEFVKHWSYN